MTDANVASPREVLKAIVDQIDRRPEDFSDAKFTAHNVALYLAYVDVAIKRIAKIVELLLPPEADLR